VRDPDTGDYLYALDNPLYGRLGRVQNRLYRPPRPRLPHRSDGDGDGDPGEAAYPTLKVEPARVEYGQPLAVSWSGGPAAAAAGAKDDANASGRASFFEITGGSVLVLACDPFPRPGAGGAPRRGPAILEAATVRQALATTSAASPPSSATESPPPPPPSPNRWRIPELPVLRYEACRFQLYNFLDDDDEEDEVAGSSIDGDGTNDDGNGGSPPLWGLLAQSRDFAPVHRPTAVHLALTGDPTEMLVRFTTPPLPPAFFAIAEGEEGGGEERGGPNEREGRAGLVPVAVLVDGGGRDVQVFEGTTETYSAEDLCQEPANRTGPGSFQDPGDLHSVTIGGLVPNRRYRYRVALKNGQGVVLSSPVYDFWSPLEPGDPQPFSYLVYGDQGCPSVGWGEGGAWTSAMAAREIDDRPQNPSDADPGPLVLPSRAVHHFGDLSYARGAAHVWDAWFETVQAFSGRVPLMVGVGNHEYDHTAGGGGGRDPSGVPTPHGFMPPWGNFGDDSGGECGVPTARRFTMPASSTERGGAGGSNGVFWYSFGFGSVHTVVISSEHDLGLGSPQREWLARDLASVNRTVTPWLIVETHRPLYEGEASWDQNAVGIAMRYEIEDLLRSFQVDLVLAGHYHAYHRTCDGLYRSRCNSGGPMHITVGTAGARLDDTTVYANGWTRRVVMGEYGYGRITVRDANALRFEFVKAGGANDTTAGQVRDEVWILRRR
jgi:hypothetical protein